MANQKKQEVLQDTLSFLQDHSHFALVKFEKTSHITLEQLRRELKKSNAAVKVVKNSLFDKALQTMAEKNKEMHELVKSTVPVRESTAVIGLNGDYAEALAAFHKFAESEKSLSFKTGFLDNHAYSQNEMKRIATLPSKPQLVAKMLGSMKSPVSHFNYAIKFNMQKLAYILNAKAQQG